MKPIDIRWMGGSCNVHPVEPGKVIKVTRESKSQWRDMFNEFAANGFIVERGIYEVLGSSHLITPYYGCRDFGDRQGLLLARADANLQEMLEENLTTSTEAERKRWCLQAAEAIAYIHERGVMHSDLRPENFLVHERNLWLSDFNGSVCEELGLDGKSLPNDGFWNGRDETTPSTDIFALGSVMYAITTGWWPFCAPGTAGRLVRTDASYAVQATKMLLAGDFPNVSSVWGGEIIMDCWTGKHTDADTVRQALASAIAKE